MPQEIRSLADSLLHNPVSVQVAAVAATADNIDQSVYFVEKSNKPKLLTHLINHHSISRALVFTRTKHGADRVVRHLYKAGIQAEAIHGNKSQNARQRALHNFKIGKTPILVASDIAARGIDVDEISHVFNYDLSNEPETYVHRIGRTARAGASGSAISFCDPEERAYLRAIEKLIRKAIPVKSDHPKYTAGQSTAQPERATHSQTHSRAPQRHSHTPQRPAQAAHQQQHQRSDQRPSAHPHQPAGPRRNAQPRHPHPVWGHHAKRQGGKPKQNHRAF